MIHVVSVAGMATVQDGGRPGRMHAGVPPGGPLAPELLAAANRALGNTADAPAIELVGRIHLRSDAPLVLATEDALVVLDGAPAAIAPRRRVGYVAVPGGLDAPWRLGGRGTLLVAGIGRCLRAGDLLSSGAPPRAPPSAPLAPPWADAPFGIVLGPDAGDARALLAGTFVVSTVGDRVGQRLTGPEIAAPPLAASSPLVRGAIQSTPGGELVVMGPDHPTTGGYPIVAVVAVGDHGRLAALHPGSQVRFVERSPHLASEGPHPTR